jgi:hypothetical protein
VISASGIASAAVNSCWLVSISSVLRSRRGSSVHGVDVRPISVPADLNVAKSASPGAFSIPSLEKVGSVPNTVDQAATLLLKSRAGETTAAIVGLFMATRLLGPV